MALWFCVSALSSKHELAQTTAESHGAETCLLGGGQAEHPALRTSHFALPQSSAGSGVFVWTTHPKGEAEILHLKWSSSCQPWRRVRPLLARLRLKVS